MTGWLALVVYLLGVPVTAAVAGYVDPPADGEDETAIGIIALAWPIGVPALALIGAAHAAGWIARKVGDR